MGRGEVNKDVVLVVVVGWGISLNGNGVLKYK